MTKLNLNNKGDAYKVDAKKAARTKKDICEYSDFEAFSLVCDYVLGKTWHIDKELSHHQINYFQTKEILKRFNEKNQEIYDLKATRDLFIYISIVLASTLVLILI